MCKLKLPKMVQHRIKTAETQYNCQVTSLQNGLQTHFKVSNSIGVSIDTAAKHQSK